MYREIICIHTHLHVMYGTSPLQGQEPKATASDLANLPAWLSPSQLVVSENMYIYIYVYILFAVSTFWINYSGKIIPDTYYHFGIISHGWEDCVYIYIYVCMYIYIYVYI